MTWLLIFFWSMKDSKDLHNKTGKNYHGTQRDPKESKAVWFFVEHHYYESDRNNYKSGYHHLIVLFAEGKFTHDLV